MLQYLEEDARNEVFAPTIANRQVFEDIYRKRLWGKGESLSGSGSSLAATNSLREALLEIIQELGLKTVVDAPCGDFNWMSEIAPALVKYTGIDIVQGLIEANKTCHASPNVEFLRLDLIDEVPPTADLLICRHLLIHLPFEQGLRILRNINSSGCKYLLTTSTPSVGVNKEILHTGGYRPVNLRSAPFDLPAPERSVRDAQYNENNDENDDSELLLYVLPLDIRSS